MSEPASEEPRVAPPTGSHGAGTPMWIGDPPVFAMVHMAPAAARVAVVVCSPFGWDEVSSYRPRYEWAEQLSASGLPTVRFDWPGTGDSAGAPSDPQRLASWCKALADVVDYLRATADVRIIAAIGIGLGGLIAMEAVRRGAAITDLVLWGSPRDGREFVRGERAFANLQDARHGADEDQLLSEGSIRSGGFLLSAQWLADLSKLDVRSGADGLRRLLLLDRDGISLSDNVIAGLRSTGAEVSLGSGAGHGAFVDRAEAATLSAGIAEVVRRWLVDSPADAHPAPLPTVQAARKHLTLPGCEEHVLQVHLPEGTPFVVVTVPDRPRDGAPTLVLLPAWAMRRSGPNRMWTEVARLAAAEGFTTARIDLAGIGDGAGSREWLKSYDNVFDARILSEIRHVLDGLAGAGYGSSFVTCGMSAGGFWALRSALEDRRIGSAVVINTGAHLLEPAWHASVARRKARAVLKPSVWMQVLRGDVDLRQTMLLAYLLAHLGRRGPSVLNRSRPMSFFNALEQLERDDVSLTLAFSSNEEMLLELQRRGLWARVYARPGVTFQDIAGLDHNLRSLAAQRDVRRVVLQHLERVTPASR